DELGGSTRPGKLRVVARPGDVALVVVRRYDPACSLDRRAVAHRSVADILASGLDAETGGRKAARLAADEGEDLAAPSVDHGDGPGGAGGEGIERGDTRDRELQREAEAARSSEPDPHPGEAAGTDADDQEIELRRPEAGLPDELVGIGEHGHGPRAPL